MNNPVIHPDFSRITSVRIYKTINLPVVLKVEANDLLDAAIYQNGAPVPGNSLPPRMLAAQETVQVRVTVARQGLVTLAKPKWEVFCPNATIFALGNYCPLDTTQADGVTPVGRRLYWDPAVATAPAPERDVDVQVTADGVISISSRGQTYTYALAPTPATSAEFHVVLLTRTGEPGSIILPATGGQPATELKL